MIEVLKIEGKMVLCNLSGMEMYLPKAMLKQYGVAAKDIKVGATFGA